MVAPRDPTTPLSCHWLHDLQPSAEPPTAASAPTTIADATARVGIAPVQWACEVGHMMATHIIEEIPELGGGTDQFDTLRMGTESATIRCLLRLSAADYDLPAITDEALRGVEQFVRRGISLDRVLRGVRLGHAQMARGFFSACHELVPAGQRTDHMQYISDELFKYIDEFSGPMAATYISERDRWMASAAAARDEAVRQILADEPVDVAAAQKTLNYQLDRQHLAVTLWYEPSLNRADTSQLQTVAHDVLQHLGALQRLIVPIGAGRLWAWGNRLRYTTPIRLDDARPAHHDIQIAVGTAGEGPAGFRLSHQQAVAAERVARRGVTTDGNWVTYYSEVAIESMLTADIDTARDFVQRELGPLASDTAHSADLRATLLSYFDEESSPFAAARQLHVSRNTVGYRVKRASEVLGFDIATRRYRLHTALILADRFAAYVLGPPPSK